MRINHSKEDPHVDSRDVRFVLFELIEIEKPGHYPAYADSDRDESAVIQACDEIFTGGLME